MVRDFLTAYGDCHEGRDSSLPPLRRQPWDTGGDELDDAAAAEVARRVRRRAGGGPVVGSVFPRPRTRRTHRRTWRG